MSSLHFLFDVGDSVIYTNKASFQLNCETSNTATDLSIRASCLHGNTKSQKRKMESQNIKKILTLGTTFRRTRVQVSPWLHGIESQHMCPQTLQSCL